MSRNPDAASLDEAYARMGGNVPLGRVGEASEVAGLIAFLLSNRGSYITGVAINVDGGTSNVV
jgi:NAD(P)-dependent dehydrogenase (short-subunit alcohol dehydrogenase family)